MPTYLPTGTSRSLGLGLTQHLLLSNTKPPTTIIATARSKSSEMAKLLDKYPECLHFVAMDTADARNVEKARGKVEGILEGKGLDVLVNNAEVLGITPGGGRDNVNVLLVGGGGLSDLESTFKVNVTGVHLVTSAFLPLLRKGERKQIVNITSTLGSIALADHYAALPAPAYKISKAALNMLTVQYSQSLAKEDFTCIMLSPGWIKTDLGTSNADLELDEAVPAVLDIIYRVKKEDTGKFFNIKVAGWEEVEGANRYDGKSPPW